MHRSLVVVAALIVFAGCSGATPPATPLPVTTVTVDSDHGPIKFKVEVAGDQQSQEYGLRDSGVAG
jgi:ABC-type glycerol-3-phosphate transport system substrate-binding protein